MTKNPKDSIPLFNTTPSPSINNKTAELMTSSPDKTTTNSPLSTTPLIPIVPIIPYNSPQMTYYTKLPYAADDWYKLVYSLFNTTATFEEAEETCQTPLTIDKNNI